MIKRTLYFGNPAYLKTENEQLVAEYPEGTEPPKSVPIEDLGMVVLDHPQLTISQQLMARLLKNDASVISCDFLSI